METKRNLKYFTAPAVSVLAIIGWAIVAVGVILLITGIADIRFPAIITIIVGIAVAILGTGGKSNDTDIEFNISERTKDLQELAEKKFEVYEKNFLKMLKPMNIRGYDFEATEEPFYYKKGNDGVNRTNYFCGCNVIFTGEKIYVYRRRFSLIDESIDETIAESFFFNDLKDATIEEKTFNYDKGRKPVSVKYYVFSINKMEGEPALRMCVDYGADIDTYTDQISRAIVTRKKELAKRAAEAAERRAAFRAKLAADAGADAEDTESAEVPDEAVEIAETAETAAAVETAAAEEISEAAENIEEAVGDAVEDVKEKAGEITEKVAETVEDAKEAVSGKISETAENIVHAAEETADEAKDQLS